MGYVIRSPRMLTLQEVSDALVKNYKVDLKNNKRPLAHLRERLTDEPACPFYMECVRQNPFEYLILNGAEVDQLVQTSTENNVPLEELCRMLARREGNDDRADEMGPPDDDEDPDLGAARAQHASRFMRGIEAVLAADPGFQAWVTRAIKVSPAAAGEYEAWAVPGTAAEGDEFESWVLREIVTAGNREAVAAVLADDEGSESADEPEPEAVVNKEAEIKEAAN